MNGNGNDDLDGDADNDMLLGGLGGDHYVIFDDAGTGKTVLALGGIVI